MAKKLDDYDDETRNSEVNVSFLVSDEDKFIVMIPSVFFGINARL